MEIFLTPKCNLNCVYCFKDRRKKQPCLKKILQEIKNAKKQITLKGGEPLLRKDILEILKYAKSKELKISLETNGILLNEKILNYLDEIYFVFDTINLEDWKRITRKSKKEYDRILKAIKLAKKLKKKIYIDVLLTKLNFNSLKETKKFCDENKLTLRILENKSVDGFDYNNFINLPLDKAKFLGNENIIYVKIEEDLLNRENLKYYKKREI